MIIWLNLFSLVFGLSAWLLPVVYLLRDAKHGRSSWPTISIMSMSAGAFALVFQLFSVFYRVKAEDWSALMDTIGAVAVVSAVFLVFTILLNGILLKVFHDRTTLQEI